MFSNQWCCKPQAEKTSQVIFCSLKKKHHPSGILPNGQNCPAAHLCAQLYTICTELYSYRAEGTQQNQIATTDNIKKILFTTHLPRN